MLRSWRVVVVALAGITGCADESGAVLDPKTADSAVQSRLAEQHDGRALGPHARRPHGGPEHLLVVALDELELTDAQRATIQAALDKMSTDPIAHGPRDKAPFAALAAGIRAGKIDPSLALPPPNAAADFEAHGTAVVDALRTLHATLTKEQRSALVDLVTQRMRTEDQGFSKVGPPAGVERGRSAEGRADMSGMRRMGPLGYLLGQLDLTDAQREAIDRALEARGPAPDFHDAMKERFAAMRTHVRAMLAAFASDAFDAAAAMPPSDRAGGPVPPHMRIVEELAAVVFTLEPAQREKLATLLEQGPPEGMPPRMGPPGGRDGRPGPAR